jgi:hypothetical protein
MHRSACFLPDDYLRKMKQDLREVEAQVEAKTRYVPDPESYDVDACDVDWPPRPRSDSALPNDVQRSPMPPTKRATPPPDDTPPPSDDDQPD